MSERILTEAFALRRYVDGNGNFNFTALNQDAVSLAREGNTNGLAQTRVVRTVEALWCGNVVQRSDKSKDVSFYFTHESPLRSAESKVGESFKEAVLTWEDGEIGIWLSPPRNENDDYEGTELYKEGRLRIVRKRTVCGISLIETYGITLTNISPEDCRIQFNKLMGSEVAKASKDLREKAIRITRGSEKKWIDFLADKIDRKLVPEEVWLAIKNGQVARDSRRMRNQFKDEVVTNEIAEAIEEAVKRGDNNQLVYLGALIERKIIGLGYNISSGVCGLLNSDILGNQRSWMENVPDIFKGTKILKCVQCPQPPDGCGQTVDAKVENGKIECLECHAKASYKG